VRSRFRHFVGAVWLLAALVGAATMGLSPAARAQTPPPQVAAAPAPEAPVVIDGKTVLVVHARLFTFSERERAELIAQRITWLARQPLSRIRVVRVVDEGTVSEIVSEDVVLMTVTEADAAAAGRPRPALAEANAAAIRTSAEALQQKSSLKVILLAGVYTLVATLLLAVLLKLLAVGAGRLKRTIASWHGVYIRTIRIQNVDLFPAERITRLLLAGGRLVRGVATLLLLYVYVLFVLGVFPWTRDYAARLSGYVLTPLWTIAHAILAYLPNLFFLAVIFTVSYYVVQVVRFGFTEIGKGTIRFSGFHAEWAEPTYKIARFLLIAFTAVVAFPYLPGSDSAAFQGVSLFLGVLFSFGSSSAIANIVAGAVLTYTRAFQIGDRVKIGDTVGDVTEKTLLVTRVRTIKNVDVSIPNAVVLGTQIVNFSSSAAEHGLILHTGVTIGYDAPWKTIHRLLIDAAGRTENILRAPAPFVLQTSLDDFYVSYEINAYTDRPSTMAKTYSDLHQHIQDAFNEAGVEIMSPHYAALRDGNTVTTPEAHRPKGYQSPPFRIRSSGE
jgi:small-conductance mechanosensitive channel